VNNPDARKSRTTEHASFAIDNLEELVKIALKASSSPDVPNTVEEACTSTEMENWEAAM